MKINATETVYNPDNEIKTVRLFELDIPDAEVRRLRGEEAPARI